VREHCIRDIAGLTRSPRQHIEACLRTPKAYGGLGLESGRGKWFRVVEEEVDDAKWETRRVAKTDPERVPDTVRRQATINMRSHGGVFSDRALASAAADAMLAGVQGPSWGAEMDSQSRLERVDDAMSLARQIDGREIDFTPPKTSVDGMFLSGMLRALLKRGWDAMSVLFDATDVGRAEMRYRAWPRNVWFDWVTGSIRPTPHDAWGLASAVSQAMKSDMGSGLIIPAGRVSRDSIRQGRAWGEAASMALRLDEKVWMGG